MDHSPSASIDRPDIVKKVTRRLIPFVGICYLIAYIDPPERQLRQAADGGRSGLERIRVWSWRVALSDARTPLSAR